MTTFILCSVMSMITGTSWGTIGTIGITMSGVGLGLGMNPAVMAGVIVGGAWFGDKISPMSDSTNLCAAVTKLMDHGACGGDLHRDLRHHRFFRQSGCV